MAKNNKQSMINPYTGKRMEMNTYSGKELMWRESNENPQDQLKADDYYDYWEDDRLYAEHEVNEYES